MKQSFKVFTPQFHQHIMNFVKQQIRSYAVQCIAEPETPELSEHAIYQSVLNILDGIWNHGRSSPVDLPAELEVPEYVEYEFDQSLIGHPVMPTMIPSSFTPVPVHPNYINKLQQSCLNMIEQTRMAAEAGYDFEQSDAEISDSDEGYDEDIQ